MLFHGFVKAILHDSHGRVGAVGTIEGLLRESLNGSNLLIQGALQIPHLVLQHGDVALQLHNLLAGAEGKR